MEAAPICDLCLLICQLCSLEPQRCIFSQVAVISDRLASRIYSHGSRTPGSVPCSQAWRDTAKAIEDCPDYRLHPQGCPCGYDGRSQEEACPAESHDNIRFAEQRRGPHCRRCMPACDIRSPRHAQHDCDQRASRTTDKTPRPDIHISPLVSAWPMCPREVLHTRVAPRPLCRSMLSQTPGARQSLACVMPPSQ